ncbi:endo-1,4-beta-xylanase 5-like [Primulina tabacum]|uniref:endo-1,4-beta-xylanase 5-like n=1 Tax=Primulina tabacum TaxID=48773 RepID=UPI003F59D5F7
MAKFLKPCLFLFVIVFVSGNSQVYAALRPYDYSYTAECLKTPLKPQYDGGIVVNPELSQGLTGWEGYGKARIRIEVADEGSNKYITAAATDLAASARVNTSFHSFAQDFHLDKDMLYSFSAWLQVRDGEAHIKAMIKPKHSNVSIIIGRVEAREGCWSMLKGGFIVDVSGPATLYFESDLSTAEIWGDSISLQPFTYEEWRSHQYGTIEKVRKTKVKLQAVDKAGQPVPNAKVSIKQMEPHFPVGSAITVHILNNTAYQNWFLPRFRYAVFDRNLKWNVVEEVRGIVNYTLPDRLLEFSKEHNLIVRGHTILWANPVKLPPWFGNLTENREYFQAAVDMRVESVVNRYKGQFIHWDVLNENMHFSFYEDKLGPDTTVDLFKKVQEIDPETTLFLNEYFTIEKAVDKLASPPLYLKKIAELRKKGFNGTIGIGLQAHLTWLSLPYMRASLDVLASTKLPVWVTELDVSVYSPDRVWALDNGMREIHSHPTVQGMLLWGSWYPQPKGCWRMCLTDDNFKNLDTGDVLDKFLNEVKHGDGVHGTTDNNGYFEASLFHGEYEAQIEHSKSGPERFQVLPTLEPQDPVILRAA